MTKLDKKQLNRKKLADVAVQKFAQDGYENVTMAEVAELAGVSRRTAFRYFPSKADLVSEFSQQWHRVFEAVVVENRMLPLPERLRVGSLAVGEYIERDPEAVQLLFRLAFEHPAIAGQYARASQTWIERIYLELTYGQDLTEVNTEARMIASAFMGLIDAACGMWANGHGDLADLLNNALDIVEAALLPRLSRA